LHITFHPPPLPPRYGNHFAGNHIPSIERFLIMPFLKAYCMQDVIKDSNSLKQVYCTFSGVLFANFLKIIRMRDQVIDFDWSITPVICMMCDITIERKKKICSRFKKAKEC
jgi:hypothetical protein